MACETVLTRYEGNPIIRPEDVPGGCNSIFNSAVVRFGDAYAGVFRVEHRNLLSCMHVGRSRDGIHWKIEGKPIPLASEEPHAAIGSHIYDPRITLLEGTYYITYANGVKGGCVIGMAETKDFRTFRQVANLSVPHNRNCVLFPERIGGKYARLERPFSQGDEMRADIWYSESEDLLHWGYFRHVMGPVDGWSGGKVGAGAPPIRTDEGWLIIYHGARRTAQGHVYCAGAALLDLERPWEVRARPSEYLLAPETPYERTGDVPNVVFPCAAVVEPDREVKVYYGAADTVIALATARLEDLVAFCLDAK